MSRGESFFGDVGADEISRKGLFFGEVGDKVFIRGNMARDD